MKKRYILTPKEMREFRKAASVNPFQTLTHNAFLDIWQAAKGVGISVPTALSQPNIQNIRNTVIETLKTWRAHKCDPKREDLSQRNLDLLASHQNIAAENIRLREDIKRLNSSVTDLLLIRNRAEAILNRIKVELELEFDTHEEILPELIRALKQSGRSDPTR